MTEKRRICTDRLCVSFGLPLCVRVYVCFALRYLGLLRLLLTQPLVEKGKEGIEDIVQVMQAYGLTKEDREYLLTSMGYKNFSPAAGGKGGAKKEAGAAAVPTAVKSALTRRLNALGMNTDEDAGFKQLKKKAAKGKGKAKAKSKK